MEILGIGTSELLFIVIIAIIILGPKDMQKAGKTIGKWLRNIITSDGWKIFQQTSRELRTLPNKLIREANEELNQIGNDINSATDPARNWSNNPGRSPHPQAVPSDFPSNKIVPPGSAAAKVVKEKEGDPEQNA